jgi:hypothetical protein
MHEKDKLSEAKHFYSKMKEQNADRNIFCYNLSAFLTAARTVLQYALNESRSKNGGQAWYNGFVSKSHVLSFFRDKRDFNIHDEPIQPRTDCTVVIGEPVHITEAISVVLKDKDGNIVGKYNSPEPSHNTDKLEPTVIGKYQHKFNDWNGNEDILELGRIYIKELEDLIKDGITKGFISG